MSEINLIELPPEILVNIFRRLKITDLRNLMLSCKYLREYIENEGSLWKFVCRGRLIMSTNEKRFPITWYNRSRISYNWCKGIFKSKLIVQHSTNYIPWMQLFSDVLILSIGSELKCFAIDKTGFNRGLLWSIHVPIMQRYDVRTNDVSRFILRENLIVCGNRDGSTVVYQFTDIRQKPRLLYYIENCHENGQVEVTAVELFNNSVITCSNISQHVCLWSMDEDISNERFVNNTNSISMSEFIIPECVGSRSLAVDPTKSKLAIGPNGNSKPILLDINTGNYLLTSKETKDLRHVIRDIQWHNENGLIYVSHSGKLQYIDIRTNDVVYDARDPFQSSLYCVKSDGDRAVIVGSSEYSRCVLFDLHSSHHVQMYFTQKKSSPIYSLDFDARKLVAAADRGVAVANFNVNASTTKKKDYSHIFEFVT
ncbi:unnamed protein product [Colias eurytheme]|nr:unnamed protein product [Colias eurytheme]